MRLRVTPVALAAMTVGLLVLPHAVVAQQDAALDSLAPAASSGTQVGVPPDVALLPIRSTPLVSRRTMTWFGVGTLVATSILMPVDSRIAHQFRELRAKENGPTNHVVSALNTLGDPGTVFIPAALLTVGWVGRNETMRDIGLHSAEAVALSGLFTAAIKGVAGRSRPAEGPLDADDFAFNRGFGTNQAASFPSGHTTAAFALATILVSETHRLRPGATLAVGIASYSLASGVGLARIYANRHWPSDVMLGAGIGTLTALAIERMAHANPQTSVAAKLIPRATLAFGAESRTNLMWSVPLPR